MKTGSDVCEFERCISTEQVVSRHAQEPHRAATTRGSPCVKEQRASARRVSFATLKNTPCCLNQWLPKSQGQDDRLSSQRLQRGQTDHGLIPSTMKWRLRMDTPSSPSRHCEIRLSLTTLCGVSNAPLKQLARFSVRRTH